jgi:hypothetical protein
MDEWSGKESYEGYFKTVQLTMINRFSTGLEKLEAAGVDIDARQGFCAWAADNIPELLNEEKKLMEQLGNMWCAGEATDSFNSKHFQDYQAVVREWGSVTNKIFNRYFKVLEVPVEQQEIPGQMALDGLSPKDGQDGVGF